VVYDRLNPFSPPGKFHDYRWQGHFQPMELTADAATKAVASSVVDGKRLYIVPARPERLELEQGKGPIADGVHSAEKTVEGPYIRYIQKSDKPVSFTVFLCPTTKHAPAPVLSSLTTQPGKEGVATDNATGVRIRQGGKDDVVALADGPGLRVYGPLTTDGEAAYVRTEQGKVVEVGLVGGRKLVYAGRALLEVGPEIDSVNVQFTAEKITAEVRGHGKLSVAAGSEKRLVLNGKGLSGGEAGSGLKGRWEVEAPDLGPLVLSAPALSTDPDAVYKALVGFRPGPALPPWNPVVVSWKTSAPADAVIEYAPLKSQDWIRTTKPHPVTDHRLVLNRLTPGTMYQIRIRSETEDGRIGTTELTYQCPGPKP
jgi:hypothetical protein